MAQLDPTDPVGSALRVCAGRTRLDIRTSLARDLARIHGQLGAIQLDAHLAEFTTDQQLVAWRAAIDRARREITAAELAIHDLVFGVEMAS